VRASILWRGTKPKHTQQVPATPANLSHTRLMQLSLPRLGVRNQASQGGFKAIFHSAGLACKLLAAQYRKTQGDLMKHRGGVFAGLC